MAEAEFIQEGAHNLKGKVGLGLAALTAGHIVAVIEGVECRVAAVTRGEVGAVRVTAIGLVDTLI